MRRFYISMSVLIVALLIATPVLAGMSGGAATGIQIQNLSTTNVATVYFQLWNQNGAAPVDVPLVDNTIDPGAAINVYMPSQSTIASGTYGGVIMSDQPLGSIVRNDWSATGGAAIYGSISPSKEMVIPLVLYKYANQTSEFTIQNTDTSADVIDVEIALYQNGVSAPVKVLSNQTIPKGTSKTYSMNDVVWGIAPNFVGSVKIKSLTKELVAQSFIDITGSRAVTGFNAIPTSSASTTLYCPLIRANYYGDTGISIVNPNASDVMAIIKFLPASGVGGPYEQQLLVPANSSAIAFQGPGGNSRTTTTPALPWGSGQSTSNPTPTNNGFAGSAIIETPTGNPVLAVVNDSLFGAGWVVRAQSTYNCVSNSDASAKVALPLVRGKHMTSLRLSTGIQIQNISDANITVSLELYNPDGSRRTSSEPAPFNIGPYGSANLWAGALSNLPSAGWYGAGILTVTAGGGKIVALVSDEGFGTTAVDSANYNGLPMITP